MPDELLRLTQVLVHELGQHRDPRVTDKQLETLIRTCFFASIQVEEGNYLAFDVALLDPENPDPTPPARVRADHWKFVRFDEPLNFDIPTLTKVAPASDRRTSLLVAYPDSEGQLKIWGFIDQGVRTYRLRRLEATSAMRHPGDFQLSVFGVGHIIIYMGFEQIAELRGQTITSKPLPIFDSGAIVDALEDTVEDLYRRTTALISHDSELVPALQGLSADPSLADGLRESVQSELLSALRRLLFRIQGYGHGGACLVVPDPMNSDLNICFGLNYRRLGDVIAKRAAYELSSFITSEAIYDLLDRNTDEIPTGLYLDNSLATSDRDDIDHELEGCLWLVALLSRVDGLVLFDSSLTVVGFGTEILLDDEPNSVWRAGDNDATPQLTTQLDYDRFGTRHRSMMRYCSQHPEATGFVVSQDGAVRAFRTVHGRLVVWDNIQLHLDFPSHERRRRHAKKATAKKATAKKATAKKATAKKATAKKATAPPPPSRSRL